MDSLKIIRKIRFLIYYSNYKKNFKIEIEKFPKKLFFFFKFDFRAFDILSLKSIENWPRSLIFIKIFWAVFEKPKIFDFVRVLSR